MSAHRAVQVAAPNGPLTPVLVTTPEPSHGNVTVRVEACGACYADTGAIAGGERAILALAVVVIGGVLIVDRAGNPVDNDADIIS